VRKIIGIGGSVGRAANDLRSDHVNIALPGSVSYDAARTIFNAAVNASPALFALCERREDVQAAVRAARKHGLPLSVRGGGHDWAGRSLRHEGLVIDLTRMRRVEVDPHAQVATIEGGVLSSGLVNAAARHGLVAVTAAAGAVGVVGLTLGGGYGPLSPRFGMAIDNVLGAEVVLANGDCVSANEEENPDLFWALRGGGGNFGCVTSMRVRLHPLGKVLAGKMVFPWSEAESVLTAYAELAASMPDELAAIPGVLTLPDGKPAVFIAPTWSGDLTEGENVMALLEGVGHPVLTQIEPMTLEQVLTMFDALIVTGRDCETQTRTLPALSSEAISLIIDAGDNMTSPGSSIVWHHTHGAPTRVSAGATPFGYRSEHFMLDVIAAWEHEERYDGAVHRQWARKVSRSLEPIALPGGYPNMLGPEEHDQIPHSYGANLARLQEVKLRVDPDRMFTSATSLPP
jgi:FAD/FMN-containing dehydrogenase